VPSIAIADSGRAQSDTGARRLSVDPHLSKDREVLTMPAPIVVAPDTHLQVRYSTHKLRDTLRPFIIELCHRIRLTGSLKESVAATANLMPDLATYFVIDRDVDESFSLRKEYLFGEWNVKALDFIRQRDSTRYRVDLEECAEALLDIHSLLFRCSSGQYDRASLYTGVSRHAVQLMDALIESELLVEQQRPLDRFAPLGVPGVYRLQHASLLYRSSTHGVLVDPQLHSTYGSALQNDVYRDQLQGKVDAVLLSHFHEDHWFLSSLLMFALDTPIVVPKVPRSTLICGDMEGILRSFGFTNVVAVDWYSPVISVGDIEIHVLPFYGEQPLRFDAPKDPAIRNWGNSYVIRTNQFSSWFLIDSGSDSLGSMIDVAEYVRRSFNGVDFVLSNLRPFHLGSPMYINGGLNWLTLSPKHMRAFDSMREHCITLGPSGVAEICAIVRPTYYLPYAHWFGDIGCVGDVGIDTPEHTESSLLEALFEALRAARADTRIIRWSIGDGFTVGPGGGFEHRRLL
jgi:hypothetical protein